MGHKNPLKRYHQILEGKKKARYLSAELNGKIEEAGKVMESCHFCERRCGVNRLKGKEGYCGVLDSKIATEFIHLGEEPELVPSYTIFFSGCTFSCCFCQNWDISQFSERGIFIPPEKLAELISIKKAKNVNWVGGDPTPNLHYILQVLEKLQELKVNLPQVWNSNMYLTEESMELLDDVMDIYLTDFKYGNNNCAKKLSNVGNYWEIITRNHLLAEKNGEVMIRHLVLPNHLECCTKPLLKWISQNMKNFSLNVMDQYRPEYQTSKFPEISRRLTWDEFQEALEYARGLGLL